MIIYYHILLHAILFNSKDIINIFLKKCMHGICKAVTFRRKDKTLKAFTYKLVILKNTTSVHSND